MRSFLVAVAAGLAGAVILHIVIILALPRFATDDAWSRAQALGAAQRFHSLKNLPGKASFRNVDPFVRSAVCVFDDTGKPIRITAGTPPPFWSLAVFDTKSNEVYSMTDRSAAERRVDVTLATPRQSIALRRAKPDVPGSSIVVDLDESRGYVVLRAIAADPTWLPAVQHFLKSATCSPRAAS